MNGITSRRVARWLGIQVITWGLLYLAVGMYAAWAGNVLRFFVFGFMLPAGLILGLIFGIVGLMAASIEQQEPYERDPKALRNALKLRGIIRRSFPTWWRKMDYSCDLMFVAALVVSGWLWTAAAYLIANSVAQLGVLWLLAPGKPDESPTDRMLRELQENALAQEGK